MLGHPYVPHLSLDWQGTLMRIRLWIVVLLLMASAYSAMPQGEGTFAGSVILGAATDHSMNIKGLRASARTHLGFLMDIISRQKLSRLGCQLCSAFSCQWKP
jgi:hypothetical protein